MALNFFHAYARRCAYSPSQPAKCPCGPVRAATAPFCANEVGLLVLWLWIASIALAIGSGAAHHPSLHPVILHAFANPCTIMVWSKCACEKLATLLCVVPS